MSSIQLYPGDRLTWKGEELTDDSGFVIATAPTIAQAGSVQSPTIALTDGERIVLGRVKSFLHFHLEGRYESAAPWTITQRGLTVTKFVADCGGREYTLNRPRLTTLRREIRAVSGGSDEGVVAVVKPAARGELQVFISGDVPVADIAFMTWALTLVDVPARRTKI